ncbi:MAG: regulatory protein RecX [Clostridiaceae bacterium]|nr:regulatory protein RecX [Clostridiaceae bacterium]
MKITSVEKNKKNKDRLSIYIDDRFSFTISEEDYLTLNLYEKTEISEETIEYIKDTLNFREARSKAVRYLSLKLRTEKEVREKLLNQGYDPDCTTKVIDDLKAIGYINNKLYAQKYLFDRSKLRPASKRMMKLELLSRGIEEETADEVLADWKVEDSSVAESLLKRKFGKYDMSDKKILRKAYMFLVHRGFSRDTIKEALKAFGSDLSTSLDD